MKKKYRILSTLLILEVLTINMMQRANMEITTWYSKIIALAVFLCPLLLLFHELSKDINAKPKVRFISHLLFWLFIVCFLLGAFVEIVSVISVS